MCVGCRGDNLLRSLQGTWKSDKEATLQELKKYKYWTAERLKIVESTFGETSMTFKGPTMTMRFLTYQGKHKPKVSRTTEGLLLLQWIDKSSGKKKKESCLVEVQDGPAESGRRESLTPEQFSG